MLAGTSGGLQPKLSQAQPEQAVQGLTLLHFAKPAKTETAQPPGDAWLSSW